MLDTKLVCVLCIGVCVSVVNADLEKRKIILKDLNAVSLYEAVMMVSTEGGSLNGSTINFKTEPFGWYQHLFICFTFYIFIYPFFFFSQESPIVIQVLFF